jgi:hypothetical protein
MKKSNNISYSQRIFWIVWSIVTSLSIAAYYWQEQLYTIGDSSAILGSVTEKDGVVQLREKGIPIWEYAYRDQSILNGSMLATGRDSSAIVVLQDGSRLEIAAGSQVLFQRRLNSDNSEEFEINLVQGSLQRKVTDKKTSKTSIKVKGKKVELDAGPSHVKISNVGKALPVVEVISGQAKVDKKVAPEQPKQEVIVAETKPKVELLPPKLTTGTSQLWVKGSLNKLAKQKDTMTIFLEVESQKTTSDTKFKVMLSNTAESAIYSDISDWGKSKQRVKIPFALIKDLTTLGNNKTKRELKLDLQTHSGPNVSPNNFATVQLVFTHDLKSGWIDLTTDTLLKEKNVAAQLFIPKPSTSRPSSSIRLAMPKHQKELEELLSHAASFDIEPVRGGHANAAIYFVRDGRIESTVRSRDLELIRTWQQTNKHDFAFVGNAEDFLEHGTDAPSSARIIANFFKIGDLYVVDGGGNTKRIDHRLFEENKALATFLSHQQGKILSTKARILPNPLSSENMAH